MKIQFRVIITTLILLATSITMTFATLDWLFQLLGHGMSGYGGGRPPGYGYGDYGGGYNSGWGGRRPSSPWSSKFPWLGGIGGNKGWIWNLKGNKFAGGSGTSGHGHAGGWQSGNNYYREDISPWSGLNGGYRSDGVWQGIGGGQLRPAQGGIFR